MKKIMKTKLSVEECRDQIEKLINTQHTPKAFTLNPIAIWKNRKRNSYFGSIDENNSFVIRGKTLFKKDCILCNGTISRDSLGTIIESDFKTSNFKLVLTFLIPMILVATTTIFNLIDMASEANRGNHYNIYKSYCSTAIIVCVLFSYREWQTINLMGKLVNNLSATVISEEDFKQRQQV